MRNIVREAAHCSLVTFSAATAHIRDVVMHMIFTQNTLSRQALFKAVLGFSSLHRYGANREAMAFKVAALAALSASAEEAARGPVEAAQHVAACMVLCAFEVSCGISMCHQKFIWAYNPRVDPATIGKLWRVASVHSRGRGDSEVRPIRKPMRP